MEKGGLTYDIISCAMTVHRKMGRGFREYVYCRALAIELRHANIPFEREVWLPIYYDQYKIASRRVDFLCANQVTIEMKAKSAIDDADFAQALNTLGRLNIEKGLLMNFGAKSLEFKLLFNTKYVPQKESIDITPELVGEPSDDLWQLRDYIPDWEIHKMQKDRQKKKP